MPRLLMIYTYVCRLESLLVQLQLQQLGLPRDLKMLESYLL